MNGSLGTETHATCYGSLPGASNLCFELSGQPRDRRPNRYKRARMGLPPQTDAGEAAKRLHQIKVSWWTETCTGHRNKDIAGSNCTFNYVVCSFSRRDRWRRATGSQDRHPDRITGRPSKVVLQTTGHSGHSARSLLQDGINCEAIVQRSKDH